MDKDWVSDWLTREFFKSEINLFEDYRKTIEKFLDAQAKEHSVNLDDLRARFSKAELDDYEGTPPGSEFDRYRLQDIDRFLNMLRHSYLITLYTFLETKLIEECHIRKSDDVLLNLTDIAGRNNLDKAKKYFKKVLKTDFPADSPEWAKIQDYQKLRNCIVHNRGKVNERLKNAQVLREIIAKTQGLTLHGDTVYLDKGFCEEAFQTIKAFLDSCDLGLVDIIQKFTL